MRKRSKKILKWSMKMLLLVAIECCLSIFFIVPCLELADLSDSRHFIIETEEKNGKEGTDELKAQYDGVINETKEFASRTPFNHFLVELGYNDLSQTIRFVIIAILVAVWVSILFILVYSLNKNYRYILKLPRRK